MATSNLLIENGEDVLLHIDAPAYQSVKIDGVNQGNITLYNFNDIADSHEIIITCILSPFSLQTSIKTDAPVKIIPDNPNWDYQKIRYFLVMSKTGLSDVELPLSSFQARRRSGKSTYLSVVIPTTDYIDDITARAGRTIKIDMAYEYNGEIVHRQTIIETEINDVNYDEGTTNQSMTIDGYSTTTYRTKKVILSHALYKSLRSGKTRYRLAKPNIYLNPGDTATINNDTFIINSITYYISPQNQTIEIESV